MSADLLNMEHINSLPHPLCAKFSGEWWEVESLDVETGCLRTWVCGMLDVHHIGSALKFRDASGVEHDPETFYS